MSLPDHAEDVLWKTIPPEHIWVLDKLILSKHLGYTCGPVGQDVPQPGWYIVRPCVNMLGLGLGARKMWIEKSTYNLTPGHFWCEWFEGSHYSVDFSPKSGFKVFTIQGFKPDNTLTKWSAWKMVNNIDEHIIPECVWSVCKNYKRINIEFIGNNPIEIHLRRNQDFDGNITEFIPVWEGEDTTPLPGYRYIDYPDIHGRIGAFVK